MIAHFCCKQANSAVNPWWGRLQSLTGSSHPLQFIRNYAAFFLLGTINNTTYVVVGSAAQSIANSFNAQCLFGLIPWANVAFGFLSQSLNAFACPKIPYFIRILITCTLALTALIGMAISVHISFWACLLMILLVGGASSFGESVFLGFLRNYNSGYVGAWSSGTGFAGVFGSVAYLLFAALNLGNTVSFLLLVPLVFIYAFCYFVALTKPDKDTADTIELLGSTGESAPMNGTEDDEKDVTNENDNENEKVALRSEVGIMSSGRELVYQTINTSETEETGQDASGMGVVPSGEIPASLIPMTFVLALKKLLRCLRLVLWKAFNLGAVYFFEYVISTGCADRAETKEELDSNIFVYSHSYVILAFCYQIGVFISRSSLRLVKIKWVWILTVLQGINMLVWIAQDIYHFLNIWVQFIWMIYVGLLGGASYVNVYYLLNIDPDIKEEDRELCINLAPLFTTAGIVSACIFILVLDNTILNTAASQCNLW